MTKIELKQSTIYYYIVCITSLYLLSCILKRHIALSVSLYNRPVWGKYMAMYWTGNIETMFMDRWIWTLVCDTVICQMNDQIWINQHWTFQCYGVMDKKFKYMTYRATTRYYFITTVWWYNILYQSDYFL
jgi:hypothetical protein